MKLPLTGPTPFGPMRTLKSAGLVRKVLLTIRKALSQLFGTMGAAASSDAFKKATAAELRQTLQALPEEAVVGI